MSKKKIKLIKTYPSSRVPDIVEYTQSIINNCILIILLLVDLPITTAEWQAKLKIVTDAQLDVKARKRGARSIVIAGVFDLKQILYDVCNYVEKKCNEAGISTLADDLGIPEYKIGVKKKKPTTSAKNTNQPGVLLIEVTPQHGARKYNLERTKVSGTGNDVPEMIDSLTSASGFRDGFERGALYMLRSQPVFGHDAMGAWSEYFLIRIA